MSMTRVLVTFLDSLKHSARPHLAARPFSLLTTFPSKELSDDSVTVKDGQLQNAAVLQRAQ